MKKYLEKITFKEIMGGETSIGNYTAGGPCKCRTDARAGAGAAGHFQKHAPQDRDREEFPKVQDPLRSLSALRHIGRAYQKRIEQDGGASCSAGRAYFFLLGFVWARALPATLLDVAL